MEEKRKRCVLAGEKLEVIWRNLATAEAEPQAEVFVGQGVDVIVAFEDASIDAAQKATTRLADPDRLPPSVGSVRDGLVTTWTAPTGT